MIRRLLAQFGFAALALTLVGGGALADSSTSPQTAPSNSGGQADQSVVNVQTSNEGTIQVQTNQNTQQTIGNSSGQSGDGSGSGASSSGGSGGSSSQATATSTTTTSTHSSLSSSDPSSPPSGGSVSGDGSGGSGIGGAASSLPPSATSGGTGTTSATGGHTGAIIESWHQVVVRLAAQVHPPLLQATPTPNAPLSQPPGAPHSQTNFFLSQLPLLLQQVIVPIAHGAPTAVRLPAFPLALIPVALIVLAGIARQTPTNSYTAGLRRSGFLGAARSDVGAATFFFATPREMGCIFAHAT